MLPGAFPPGGTPRLAAVARITNALDEFQPKTSFPGLFPTVMDASGCGRPRSKKPKDDKQPPKHDAASTPLTEEAHIPAKPGAQDANGVAEKLLNVPAVVGGTGKEVFVRRAPPPPHN